MAIRFTDNDLIRAERGAYDGAIKAGRNGPRWEHRSLLLFLLFASCMSIYIVGSGIRANGNFALLFGGPWIAYSLALLIQGFIAFASYWLASATAWRGARAPLSLLMAITVGFFVVFEVTHALLVQVRGALGNDIYNERKFALDSIHAAITGVDQEIIKAYQHDLTGLKQAAADAEVGNDPSGKAGRGPYFRLYQSYYAIARNNYSHLQVPIAGVPPARASAGGAAPEPVEGELNELWLAAGTRMAALRARLGDYQRLGDAIGKGAQGLLSQPVRDIADRMLAMQPDFQNNHILNRQTASIDTTVAIVRGLLHGEVRSNAYLWSMAYALAAPLLAFWFRLMLKWEGEADPSELKAKIREDQEINELLEQHSDVLREQAVAMFTNRVYRTARSPHEASRAAQPSAVGSRL